MTRAELLQLIQDNVPDNESKLITAEMMRDVLNALVNNGYILDSDLLKDVDYNTGQTLEQRLQAVEGAVPLWGLTGAFDVGGPSGSLGSNEGIITSVTLTQLTSRDTQATILFNQSISGKRVVVNVLTDSGDMNANNDVGAPVVRVQSNGIIVGLLDITGSNQSVRLQVLVFQSQ